MVRRSKDRETDRGADFHVFGYSGGIVVNFILILGFRGGPDQYRSGCPICRDLCTMFCFELRNLGAYIKHNVGF